MRTFLTIIISLISVVEISIAEPFNWKQTNGPTGGETVRLQRDTKGNAYVYTWQGKLFINEPGTAFWRYLRDDVSQILIDKFDNIYIKTLSDGSLNLFDSDLNFIKKVREDSVYHYTILSANANGDVYVGIENEGLFYTSDKGNEWSKISETEPYFICFDSTNAALFATSIHGLRFTRDNWQTTEGRIMDASAPENYPYTIEYNQKWNTWIAYGPDSALYVSQDTGKSWAIANPKLRVEAERITIADNGEAYNYSWNSMWVSHDGGYNWEKLYDNKYVFRILSFIHRDNEIIASAYRVLMRYEMNTNNQEFLMDGLIASEVSSIVKDNEGNIYSVANSFVWKTSDEGTVWECLLKKMLPESWIDKLFVASSGTLYVRGGIASWISKDKGTTWKLLEKSPTYNTYGIVLSYIDGYDRLYGLGDSIYYSDDEAETWKSIDHQKYSSSNLYSFASYKDKLVIIKNGNNKDTLLYSEDRGITFRELPIVTQNYIMIECAFNSKGDLYCGLIDKNYQDSLFVSTDGANSFSALKIPFRHIREIKFDRNDYLYALTKDLSGFSLYYVRTTDKGLSWEYVVDTNNIKLKANCIYFDDKNQAFLGTVGDGVWKADVIKGIPIENNSNHIALRISPNPASECANITLDELKGAADITVYNQLGEVVYQTRHSEGSKEFEIPVAEFPQGAYFVKVSSGGEVIAGKFAVVR